MSPPAVLEPLLGNHGEALAQPVHGVHRPRVMVDPPLALPTVPVLAQPVEVQVERAGRLQKKKYMYHFRRTLKGRGTGTLL